MEHGDEIEAALVERKQCRLLGDGRCDDHDVSTLGPTSVHPIEPFDFEAGGEGALAPVRCWIGVDLVGC